MKRAPKIALVAFVFLLPVVYGGVVLTRPLATRGDLQSLVAGRLNADAALASEVCGAKVDSFIWPSPKIQDLSYGEWPWAHVATDSWSPLYSKDGTMTARVSGVGVDSNQKPLTEMRTARLRFSYHCAWEDNGRSNNFVCTMATPPVVVRE